jgi:hypothetical protein
MESGFGRALNERQISFMGLNDHKFYLYDIEDKGIFKAWKNASIKYEHLLGFEFLNEKSLLVHL